MSRTNLILIGMPASGKSTVGVILAKVIGYDFIDTDLLIQKKEQARQNAGPVPFANGLFVNQNGRTCGYILINCLSGIGRQVDAAV